MNKLTQDSNKISKRRQAGYSASLHSQCPSCLRKGATSKQDLFGYRKQRVCRYCGWVEPLDPGAASHPRPD